jgi:hypothetical protein
MLGELQEEGIIRRAGRLWTLAEGGSDIMSPDAGEPSPRQGGGSLLSTGTAVEANGNRVGTTGEQEVQLAVPAVNAMQGAGEPPKLTRTIERDGRQVDQVFRPTQHGDRWFDVGVA